MYLRITSWITTRTARCRSRFGHRAGIVCSELVLPLAATQPHAATLPRQQRPFANCPLSRPRSVPRNAVTDNSRPTLPIPAHRRGRPRTQTFGTGAAYLTPRVVARGGPRPSADRPPTTLTGQATPLSKYATTTTYDIPLKMRKMLRIRHVFVVKDVFIGFLSHVYVLFMNTRASTSFYTKLL